MHTILARFETNDDPDEFMEALERLIEDSDLDCYFEVVLDSSDGIE